MARFSFNRLFLIKLAIFLTLCIEVTNTAVDFSMPIYGNIVGFGMLFIVLLKNYRRAINGIATIIIIFAGYFIINPALYLTTVEPHKAVLYALVAILLSIEFQKINFSIILDRVFFGYLLFIICLFYLGVGVDETGGALRIQGLMSEPSALSLILCFLFWTYWKLKQYRKLAVVTFVCALTLSLTVYANIAIFYLLLLFSQQTIKALSKLVILAIFTFFLVNTVSNFESENWLVSKASVAAQYILSGGKEGKFTRAIDIDRLIDEQNRNELSIAIGNGPNYGVHYYSSRGMLTNTHNFLAILFINYGLIGLMAGSWWIMYVLVKIRDTPYHYLYLSAMSYVLVNTASGIVNDIYLFVILFYSTRIFTDSIKSNFEAR